MISNTAWTGMITLSDHKKGRSSPWPIWGHVVGMFGKRECLRYARLTAGMHKALLVESDDDERMSSGWISTSWHFHRLCMFALPRDPHSFNCVWQVCNNEPHREALICRMMRAVVVLDKRFASWWMSDLVDSAGI